MLKKLLSLFAIATFTSGFAQQIPNGGFESWTPQSGPPAYNDPNGWGTPNMLSSALLGSNPVSVSQGTGADANSGTYSMKIVTFHYTPGFANITAYLPNDTLGFALTGKVDAVSPYLHPGYTQTIRYAQFDFYAKYVPVGSDAGACIVSFTKWNSVSKKRDTVASGATAIASNASFAKLTVPLTYKLGIAPDTGVVIFYSSNYLLKPQVGSALYIDDAAFSGLVLGINERNMLLNTIKVYPNPATTRILFSANMMHHDNLSAVEIFNAAGSKVDAISIQNNQAELNTSNYAEGLYLYNAYNDNKELIGVGKFNIVK